MFEDVSDIFLLESIIDSYPSISLFTRLIWPLVIILTDVDSPCGSNAENRFEEGWGVWAEDAHSLKPMLLQVVCQTPCTICELAVRPTKDLVVGSKVVDCLGLLHPVSMDCCETGLGHEASASGRSRENSETYIWLNCCRTRQEESR